MVQYTSCTVALDSCTPCQPNFLLLHATRSYCCSVHVVNGGLVGVRRSRRCGGGGWARAFLLQLCRFGTCTSRQIAVERGCVYTYLHSTQHKGESGAFQATTFQEGVSDKREGHFVRQEDSAGLLHFQQSVSHFLATSWWFQRKHSSPQVC